MEDPRRLTIANALMDTFWKHEADSSWPHGRCLTLADAVLRAIRVPSHIEAYEIEPSK